MMDDADDGCQTASKRHKSEDSIEEKEGKDKQTNEKLEVCPKVSQPCANVGNDAGDNENSSNSTILGTTLPSSTTDLLTGDSGIDVGFNGNVAENPLISATVFPKTQYKDEDTSSFNNADAIDNNDKMDRSDSGLLTDECSTSTVTVKKSNKTENASNTSLPLADDINEKENATSFKRNEKRSKDNLKVRIYRNRLSFMSSSSDDDDAAEVQQAKDSSLQQNALDVKCLADNQEKMSDIATSSTTNSAVPSDITLSTLTSEENATGGGLSVSNETTETTTTASEENQQRRRRGNRSARRNYRNRIVLSTPSSSAEEEEVRENSIQGVVVNSNNENVESHSDEENAAESSEMDVSLASVSSESINIFPRHIFNDSSSDSDDDSNTDDAMNEQMNDSMNEEVNNEQNDVLHDVLNKPKPAYTWNSTYELMRREHGLTGNGRYTLRNGMSSGFITRFYSSRHIVERMKLLHCLRKHTGCVNCMNFNRSGDILCSGSDDTRIIIWDWAQNKPKHIYKSGHTENIFQTKFIESGSGGFLDIVSAGRDGQVRRAFIPSSGGKVTTACLYRHRGAVHKLVVCPQNPTEIISVGEDGHIKHQDIRKEPEESNTLKMVKANNKKIKLFSISHHPFKPEICVCGCDRFVRIFDKRNMNKTVYEMCPQKLIETPNPQVTCSVYNSTGSEVLSSYSDDHIYLFNNTTYKKGDYLHCYKGHYNHRTIKGVNFFGPNSEYVISGSDCGNIFFWDKNTECILNFMPGDTMGVVNCLEPHPSIPVLATSGLDHNIKIWAPNSEIYPPDLSKLGERVKRNLKRSVIEEANEADDRQFHYFLRQFLRNARSASASNDSQSQNVPETQSSSSSSEDDYTLLEGLNCRTQ